MAGQSRATHSVCARAAQKGDRLYSYHQSSGATALQRHSDSEESASGRVRRDADERPAKLHFSATTGARATECQRTFHRPRTSRIEPPGAMGERDTRWLAQRSSGRAGPKSLAASLQRSTHLYPENLRTKSTLLLSAGPQTPAGGGRDRDESHPALYSFGQ